MAAEETIAERYLRLLGPLTELAKDAKPDGSDIRLLARAVTWILEDLSAPMTGPVKEPLPSSTAPRLDAQTENPLDELRRSLWLVISGFSSWHHLGLPYSVIDQMTSTALKSIQPLLTGSGSETDAASAGSGAAQRSAGDL